MNKKEALALAKEHAGKSDTILVTSDGCVFFKPQGDNARHHAKLAGLELFEFTSEDLGIKTKKAKDEETNDEEGEGSQDNGSDAGDDSGVIAFENISKSNIIKDLTDRGIEFAENASKKELYALYIKK